MADIRNTLHNIIDRLLEKFSSLHLANLETNPATMEDIQEIRKQMKVIASGYQSARYFSEEGEDRESLATNDTDFYRLERLGKALQGLPTTIVKNLHDHETWLQLGEFLSAFNQDSGAKYFFLAVVQCDASDDRAWRLLGESYLYSGMDDDAIVAFKQSLEIDPDEVETWFDLGMAFHFKGEENEAKKAFQTAIENDPDNEELIIQIAEAYLDNDEHQEAIEYYKEALRINPKNSDAWLGLGNILTRTNKKVAIDAMLKAMRYDPENWRSHMELARLFYQAGQQNAAFELLDKVVKSDELGEFLKDKRYHEIWLTFAKNGLDKKKIPVLINISRKIALLKQDDSNIWCFLGQLYVQLADLENAVKAYKRSTYANPRNPEAWRNLAIALLENEQGAAAEDAVRKYNTLIDENEDNSN